MKTILTDDPHRIIIEDAEVIRDGLFTAEVVSVHDGYVFLKNVRKAYEAIETNGDVSATLTEGSVFEIGQLVQFDELNTDPNGNEKFRAEGIKPISSIALASKITSIVRLSKETSPYHLNKKIIPDVELTKAEANHPLDEFIAQIALLFKKGEPTMDEIVAMAEKFIAKNFPLLTPLGMNFSINGDVDISLEKGIIENAMNIYNNNDLKGQADTLQKEYEGFLPLREAFTFMSTNKLLTYSSIIDMKYLPELAFAFPVWYVHGKELIEDETTKPDPRPDHSTIYFSDQVGSTEFAWFFQLYNRRTRPLSHFSGRDLMPLHLVETMKLAKEQFDYVTIMTPYHDVASTEWSDPEWLRNLDPLLVGFKKGLNFMFILGRWSGTGLFPLFVDCIADTANHLKINKLLVNNFKANSYWYKGEKNGTCLESSSSSDKNSNTVLLPFVEKLLATYDKGKLFEFLRGELKPEELAQSDSGDNQITTT